MRAWVALGNYVAQYSALGGCIFLALRIWFYLSAHGHQHPLSNVWWFDPLIRSSKHNLPQGPLVNSGVLSGPLVK